jgi:hypothetical protein
MSNRDYTTVDFKVSGKKFCKCPNSEPGKINLESKAHVPGCPIRKKLSRFVINTSVTPEKYDGYSLGVAIGSEEA